MAKLSFNLNQKQSMVTSFSAALAALLVLILVSLLLFVLAKGGDYFWPKPIHELHYWDPQTDSEKVVFGQRRAKTVTANQVLLHYSISSAAQPKNGTLTISSGWLLAETLPENVAIIRLSNGNTVLAEPQSLSSEIEKQLPWSDVKQLQTHVERLSDKIEHIRRNELAVIHNRLASMDQRGVDTDAPARLRLSKRFYQLQDSIAILNEQLQQYQMQVAFADGQTLSLALSDIDSVAMVNQASFVQRLGMAMRNIATFVSESPKLENTTGGVFPALFGTVLMVLLMTVFVTPFGVGAALYLHEYAPKNRMTSLIRVAVNNLAGVPSIVYGVFGLGLFVYALGGSIDELFFAHNLPAPTFGSPGLIWASLTMAILTLPVVIVATEEGLRRVPTSLKQGSYALGATQAETMFKTVLPMASPGIMTGIILAIARGAGEVAPLLLVGAVKFAPALPVDGEFPYFHLQRQFMHLGVLIYDGAFHSQSIGSGSSFMFACCLLLLVIVVVLNLIAGTIRNQLRKQYSSENF